MGSSPCRNYSLLGIAHLVVGPHFRYMTGTGGRHSIEVSIVKKVGLWISGCFDMYLYVMYKSVVINSYGLL